jgi:protoporphyrinogen oxidase
MRSAVVIGGGPAGLTAALELAERTDIHPIVLEASDDFGGIARTYEFKGNRIDIGGHRFFSKSDRVMEWWTRLLPIQGGSGGAANIGYQGRRGWLDLDPAGPDPATVDEVMLVRPRVSRILFRGKLFDYPLSLSLDTLSKLGPVATARIGSSYVKSAAFPIAPEVTLEHFFINRFGRELYDTFFRDYTEKVWGVSCAELSAEWGAQRVKGVSLLEAVRHAARALVRRQSGVAQKDVETSLIEQFLYPKFGPGQMWRKAARLVAEKGGEVHLGARVTKLRREGERVVAVSVRFADGAEREIAADLFFCTMPVRDLAAAFDPAPPAEPAEVAGKLAYRDFITVGLLLDRLKLAGDATGRELASAMPDTWLYVQEPDVKVGRLQFFNNWSPWLVADPDKVWLGLEYFCDEGGELWRMDDGALRAFAARELEKIGVIRQRDVADGVVIRVPKTYPAYHGAYGRFDKVRAWVDGLSNLVLLGRNGMHRYNNQDHSMLTAMTAVDGVVAGRIDKAALWAVNTEQEYHEERKPARAA